MKPYLMFRDADFNPEQPLPPNAEDLIQDLALEQLIDHMAKGDLFLADVANVAILTGVDKIDLILYRQEILIDCLEHPDVIRALYQLPIESKNNKHRRWLGIYSQTPRGVLNSAVQMMMMFVYLLKKLRKIADKHAHKFNSEGFKRFFLMVKTELNDEYLKEVANHLNELQFKTGVWISVTIGEGIESKDYTLRLPKKEHKNAIRNIFNLITKKTPLYSFMVDARDDSGTRALADLKDRGLNYAADALAQAANHVDEFFDTLRNELAFYIGCLNLYEELQKLNLPMAMPEPCLPTSNILKFQGLCDACLALTAGTAVVSNDLNADNKDLVIITGANQGGKSTFLRSVGQAQLMMQAGMFVAAKQFQANLCPCLFTHFRRKEDVSMKSGKLDEELARMSEIIDVIRPHSMILFNESFSATNEREGSEIAKQITKALLDKGIKVFHVTHMYELALSFYQADLKTALFLRAQREPDGTRTFKITTGEPRQTSFGKDIYLEVFTDTGQKGVD